MRIGKHTCGGEFVISSMNDGTIYEVRCKKCGYIKTLNTPIMSSWKKRLIENFKLAMRGLYI